MFAYCENNPVNRSDLSGEFWNVVIGAAVGGVLNALATAIDSYESTGCVNWGDVAISAAVGAISGGVAATGLGVFVQGGITAAVSGIGTFVTEYRNQEPAGGKKEITGKMLLKTGISAAVGFCSSVIGTGAGKVVSQGIEQKGAALIKRGTYKVGCYSKAQAQRFIKQGKKIVNTARGIGSIIGTLFTWPTATTICSQK